ncbi:MAG: ABC transporter permease [Thermoprotei archaeon]|nr:MAG: ABC transporter permease [Thermoprotei archaeon]
MKTRLNYLKTLIWKELLDLSRDKKTIFTSILLPLVMLPLIGLLSLALVSEQPVRIAVIDLDNNTYTDPYLNITFSSKWVLNNITYYLKKYGYIVNISHSTDILYDPSIDLVVVIPKGFSKNATSLDNVARVIIYKKAGVQAATRAESTISSVLNYLSYRLSNEKISSIARLLNVTIIPDAIRNPVQSKTEIVTIHGTPAQPEIEMKNMFARILVLGLSFVIAPAASFVIDGIIGERERKTIEMLLASPAPVTSIIYSKMIAATVLGLITAIADAMGLVAYMFLFSLATGIPFGLVIDPMILLVHSITAFFTILSTITISLPFITRTRGIRTASNIASIVTTIGIVFFFTGFMIDYIRLPPSILYPLYLVPFTHSILVIQSYIVGYYLRAILHGLVLAISSVILLFLTAKTISTERLLVAPL